MTGILSIGLAFVFLKIFESQDFFRYFMEHLYRVDGIAGTNVLMLALGFATAQIINCIVLWVWFEKEHRGFSVSILRVLYQSFSASVIMGFVSYLFLNVFANAFDINTVFGIFMQGFLSGIMGIISLVIVLRLLKSPELDEAIGTFHKKFWKTRPIIPDTSAEDL